MNLSSLALVGETKTAPSPTEDADRAVTAPYLLHSDHAINPAQNAFVHIGPENGLGEVASKSLS